MQEPTPLDVRALVQEPQRRQSTRSTSDRGRLISLDDKGKQDRLLKWEGPMSVERPTMDDWREGSRLVQFLHKCVRYSDDCLDCRHHAVEALGAT